ncbi:hypothetical protein KY290_008980 [Solanum tuberosum]|uniref:Integrase core domain containing protein n=1 Tax=Solanum tuberosum TaxID=4113 RepID=A0ABQ7WC00_SOLTU|nr:hypothetical protein KY289_009343 [Solanum tuberosum]KAH0716032.1 hypothetical protein KY284_008937 [Solanum tuberosum]KAH0777569.1 hypothetical protein KY290_008980 [Solanum tuberosum]
MGEASSPSITPTVSSSLNLAHQLPVKLTTSNFLLRKTQFMPMIYTCGLNHHIDESILPQLVGVATARAAWDKLVDAYASRSRPYIRELKSQLHTLRHDNSNIESYVQKAKGIEDKLVALQHPIPNDDLVEFVLTGLGPSYRHFTRSLESRQEEITFDALTITEIDEALTVMARTTQYTQSSLIWLLLVDVVEVEEAEVVGAPQIKDSNHLKIVGKGHIAHACPSPRNNSGNKVFVHTVSNLARNLSPQNWLMDSGTTLHLIVDLDNLGIHCEYQGPKEVTIGLGDEGHTAQRPE